MEMSEREDTIERIERVLRLTHEKSITVTIPRLTAERAVSLLKEFEGLLGMQQTADGITFISTGTAQQGEERGIMLGKAVMHEWIYKELIHKGLLTDEIQLVFEQAKCI